MCCWVDKACAAEDQHVALASKLVPKNRATQRCARTETIDGYVSQQSKEARMADVQPAGRCSRCQGEAVTCRYNLFEQEDLRIDSWEHKCPDCGHRETTAYRSDEADQLEPGQRVDQCPYCNRRAPDAG